MKNYQMKFKRVFLSLLTMVCVETLLDGCGEIRMAHQQTYG